MYRMLRLFSVFMFAMGAFLFTDTETLAGDDIVTKPVSMFREIPTYDFDVEVAYAEWDVPLTEEEIELIALLTMAEAEGESEYGKRLVIDTILNRVDSDQFPDTVYGVVYQKGQFTSMWNGRSNKVEATPEVIQLVMEELESRTNSDVIFFRTRQYSGCGTPLFKVGHHYFSGH